MTSILLFALVVVMVFVCVRAARKPDTFRIARSITVNAAPEKVRALLGNPRASLAWSPWEQKDPNMKRSYSGRESGVGATYEWDGNRNIGKGRMEIIEAEPLKVVTRLEFLAPFKATNTAEFILVPQGAATELTWAMYGPQPFIGKLIHMLTRCDRMIAREFDKGLANIKALAEK